MLLMIFEIKLDGGGRILVASSDIRIKTATTITAWMTKNIIQFDTIHNRLKIISPFTLS